MTKYLVYLGMFQGELEWDLSTIVEAENELTAKNRAMSDLTAIVSPGVDVVFYGARPSSSEEEIF